jgi:crossover junction endodeoxyribonuclease RuvC
MKLLAIDPGYDKTGYAVFESPHPRTISFVASGLIKTIPSTHIELRLGMIIESLERVISSHHTTHMVMEQLFFFKNAKTVIGVAQAQGAIMSLTTRFGLQFAFLTPLQIKQAITGDGRAEKMAVWKMLKLQLKSSLEVEEDDESDAIACGYAYCLLKDALLSR